MGKELTEKEIADLKKPITPEEFWAFHKYKAEQKAKVAAEAARKRAEDIAAGRVPMNGRELFIHEPWVFDDVRATN